MTLTLPYQLQERVATGRFATVYRATHNKFRTQHAVKRLLLNRQDIAPKKNTTLIQSEITQWRRVTGKSEYILPLCDVLCDVTHENDEVCLLVSPFASGGNLRTAVLKLPLDHKIRIARQLALALKACHDEGVLHGDVKPDNVLLDENARTQLGDFGSSVPCSTPVDGCHVTWMTMNYVPPEAMQPSSVNTGIGHAADMWAYGVTIFELLHDMEAMPFDNRKKLPDGLRMGSPVNDPNQQTHMYWPASTRHTITNPLTHPLCDVIIGCLERNPKERLTASQVVYALGKGCLA